MPAIYRRKTPKFAQAQIVGAAEMERLLEGFEPKLRRKYLRSALGNLGSQLRKAAAARVPVRSGRLKKSLAYKVLSYKGAIVCVIGPKSYEAPHKHLVEYGTKERFTKKGKPTGKMPRRPFMQPAVDSLAGSFGPTLAKVVARFAAREAAKKGKG